MKHDIMKKAVNIFYSKMIFQSLHFDPCQFWKKQKTVPSRTTKEQHENVFLVFHKHKNAPAKRRRTEKKLDINVP